MSKWTIFQQYCSLQTPDCTKWVETCHTVLLKFSSPRLALKVSAFQLDGIRKQDSPYCIITPPMNYVANGNLFFQKQQNNPLLFIFPSLLSPDVLFTRCCYHHCHFYLRRQDCSGLTSLLSDMLTSWMPKMSSYESITDKPFLYGIIILMNIKKFIELSSVVFL